MTDAELLKKLEDIFRENLTTAPLPSPLPPGRTTLRSGTAWSRLTFSPPWAQSSAYSLAWRTSAACARWAT